MKNFFSGLLFLLVLFFSFRVSALPLEAQCLSSNASACFDLDGSITTNGLGGVDVVMSDHDTRFSFNLVELTFTTEPLDLSIINNDWSSRFSSSNRNLLYSLNDYIDNGESLAFSIVDYSRFTLPEFTLRLWNSQTRVNKNMLVTQNVPEAPSWLFLISGLFFMTVFLNNKTVVARTKI
jgi:hypothetical protein